MTNKNERIIKIENRLEQLQNQKKKLIQEQKKADRTARTRRLIERGAVLESLIDGADLLTTDQITHILKCTVGSSFGDKIIAQTKSNVSNPTVEQIEIPSEEGS